ncbi:Glycine--tRNA ligase 1, mitochondrial [Paramarasmius palmivorus]|uniref:glycine--tRNA ligase n=1 Tax=Paramarasmius palmivorus TaxID=297713 RepID=A0AAW0EE99_9AGAR
MKIPGLQRSGTISHKGFAVQDPFAPRRRTGNSTINALLATALFRCWHILIFFGAWATLIAVLNHQGHELFFQPTLLTVIGTVLGFVISYRTTSSFERYNEGRRLWAQIILGTRTFARTVWFHIPDPPATETESADVLKARAMIEKTTVINLLEAFSVSVKHYLRGEDGIYYDKGPLLPRQVPSCICSSPRHTVHAELNQPTDPHGGHGHPEPSTSSTEPRVSEGGSSFVHRRVSEADEEKKALESRDPAEHHLPLPATTPNTPRKTHFLRPPAAMTSAHDGALILTRDDEKYLLPPKNPPKYHFLDLFPFSLLVKVLTKRGKTVKGKKAARLRAQMRNKAVSHNLPLEISLYLSSYISALQNRKIMDVPTTNTLLFALNQLVDSLTGLERIRTTPIPFSYSIHLWVVTVIYCFALPPQIWLTLKWLTIPATVILAFIFFGFLVAGEEIENPFGYDKNDLNLDHFTQNIIRNELKAITSTATPDPARWAFVAENDLLFARNYHTDERLTPQDWMARGYVQMQINKTAHSFDKTRLDALLNRRFFYAPAFEIYGGVAGLYDYGPSGSALQANIIAEWRKHFIVEESMLELDTTIMTPAPVFETSGHVARFADWMVKDTKTGDVLRADHLLGIGRRGVRLRKPVDDSKDKKKKKKAVKTAAVQLSDELVKEYEVTLAQLDNFGGPELGELCRKYQIKNPDTDNEVTEPQEFNLMFASSIGPTGRYPGYLRPETAQGHFLNFSRLLDFNNGRVPFASAQIGRSFRNEISPRAGLLRVREFTMAEIEHYVDPLDKSHPKFDEVRDTVLVLLDRNVQASGSTQVIKMFRQHMSNEMAHYATDCWDAEIENSTGWTECVGCADRAAYDLTVHSAKTGHPLVVRQALKEPIVTEKEVVTFDKKLLGKTFKQDAGVLQKHMESLEDPDLLKLKEQLSKGATTLKIDGKDFDVSPELLKIERKTFKQSIREYTPNVIEPSFGLGRILYTLLEHSFWSRESDVERGVLSLPPLVAPTKVLIVPLSAKEEFDPLVNEISTKLRRAGIFSRVDDSNTSIGKRYARNDELGTPYGITIDFASVQNRTVTIRERDTMDQRISSIDEVIATVTELVEGSIDWAEACRRLPAYDGVQAID